MKKVILLLISLNYMPNMVSDIALRKIETSHIHLYQDKFKNEITNNKFIKLGLAGAASLIVAYLAYKKFYPQIANNPTNSYSNTLINYPNLIENNSTIEELCRLKRENRFVLSGQSFWTGLKANWKMTVGLPIVSYSISHSLGHINKIFKEININSVIQDKTIIPIYFKALKNVAAALDNKSFMFSCQYQGDVTDYEAEAINLKRNDTIFDVEIMNLKIIAVANYNMSTDDVNSKIINMINFLNELTSNLEKVLGFMHYKADYYKQINMLHEFEQTNQLIYELTDLITQTNKKLEIILSNIQNDKVINKENGLLHAIFEYQNILEINIKRFEALDIGF